MRILYVSHSFPLRGDPVSNVGGMQRVATGLHAALAARGDLRLSSLVLETSWKATPYRMPGFMAGLLRAIPRVVEEENVDVVLFSSMVTASLAVALRKRLRGTVLAAIPVGRDVTLPTPGYPWFVRRVFRALDMVFPISRATADECLARGADPASVHVVPCGVDVGAFEAPRDRAAARRELLRAIGESPATVPDDALLLVSVGRHQERKGFQWFADEVMPRLPADVFYLVTGEGPMTPRIRAAIGRHGLQGRARLLGKVPEAMLRTLYRGGDLFVMPNIHVPGDIEGFGVVMLEAGMCGMPVLAADLEGISDVVREGENGHLVPSRDAAAFAQAVMGYRADRARLSAASRAAARWTARTYSWDGIADQFVEIFRERLGRPAPAPAARAAGAR
ncbi:glycosyltransferase family 4 protein [Longimicrobium sp.]|uniref:glycosyltransferase family 4 protein n=1 Tax=Longimicrobium sp. TaxID=2029185 RepID=UPI002B77F823|nr:glycosyltransferase family 4 protein [Longimicrobium sp.]HSU15856.1 glycosyltransferase family 4 protein [Longimicrobium sp.]